MTLAIDLSGRVALVTGATAGIGAGIARTLAEAGCDVAGCATDPKDAPQAARFRDTVQSSGRRAFYAEVDLGKPDAPGSFVTETIHALGRLDIVVSSAGRNVFEGVDACTEARWRKCMELDLAAHWRLGKAARPHLTHGNDAVFIIIGSNHAQSTLPGCFPYNVAKAGLVAMAQSMALEWGPRVRAVCIAPGFIDTPAGDAWFDTFEDPDAKRQAIEQAHPVGRIGTPGDIGSLCAFLASPHAGFISGTTILVDGGHAASMGW